MVSLSTDVLVAVRLVNNIVSTTDHGRKNSKILALDYPPFYAALIEGVFHVT